MRTRVEQLRVSPASVRGVGSDEIEVVLPDESSASTPEGVGETGQLYFYDWEPNVIGANGQPAPAEGTVTGDGASDGPGGFSAGLPEYQALLRAAKRPVVLRKADTTWSSGCTPRQAGGCLYGGWYLLDTTHEKVLRGPEDTKQELYAEGYKPPAGAKPRAERVNPGTVLVQAHAVETAEGKITEASPNSWYVLNDNPVLTGADLLDPEQSKDEFTGQPDVVFGFTAYGKTAFERVTKEIAHRGQEAQLPGVSKEAALQHFAVVLDNRLITAPSIDYTRYPEGIGASTGSEISGGFTIASAQNLVNELQSGALPIRLELVSRLRIPTASSG
jgi:SecD/SecF fusion protein